MREIHTAMTRIYLDNAATTAIEPKVWAQVQPYFTEHFGNAASIHSFGQVTKNILEEARERVARVLGASPAEIFFTSSGTEANNFALKGFAFAMMRAKKPFRFISSRLEHKAVLESLAWLESVFGTPVLFVEHDACGTLDLDSLKKLLCSGDKETVTLVSIMHANNELGNINPLKEITQIAKQYGAFVHSDAVQTAAKLPIHVEELGVDMLSISGHKFHAPKGIGAIYVRKDVPIEPLLHGGSHERNRRAGTENYAFAFALAEALQHATSSAAQTTEHVRMLRKRFLAQLEREGIAFEINGQSDAALPHIVNLTFNIKAASKVAADVLLLAFDAYGIAVSSGSACTSGTEKPSHVLLALGKTEQEARASIRVSFSKFNTVQEVEEAAQRMVSVLKRWC
ncbi:MAG: cysteine desulfurase family protein [Candidatus Thermochlorobacter sp.]